MKELVNNGSYVVIQPVKQDELWEGIIISSSKYHKHLIKGSTVYYKDDDATQIMFKGKKIHLVLHYLIPFIEVETNKPDVCASDFNFNGLTV